MIHSDPVLKACLGGRYRRVITKRSRIYDVLQELEQEKPLVDHWGEKEAPRDAGQVTIRHVHEVMK